MEKVRFVYFDMGNVLLKFSVRRLLHQVAALAEVSDAEAKAVFFDDKKYLAYEMGEISSKEYFAHICRGFGKSLPLEEFLTASNDIFWVNESILPLVRHLAKEFFPRGILSNTGPQHWAYIESAYPRIWKLFPNHHITSYSAHAMKPFPEIYKIALDEARKEIPDLTPEQILLIDDLEENVKGAADFGFQAVQYLETEPLLESLKEFGVPVPEE